MTTSREAAADLGARAVIYLAERPDEIAAFLAETGVDPADLRAAASDPQMLGFVLAHVESREPLAEAFCVDAGVDAEGLRAARAALLGAETHWT